MTRTPKVVLLVTPTRNQSRGSVARCCDYIFYIARSRLGVESSEVAETREVFLPSSDKKSVCENERMNTCMLINQNLQFTSTVNFLLSRSFFKFCLCRYICPFFQYTGRKFCGTESPRNFAAASTHVSIKFRTDSSVIRKGFSISWMTSGS